MPPRSSSVTFRQSQVSFCDTSEGASRKFRPPEKSASRTAESPPPPVLEAKGVSPELERHEVGHQGTGHHADKLLPLLLKRPPGRVVLQLQASRNGTQHQQVVERLREDREVVVVHHDARQVNAG